MDSGVSVKGKRKTRKLTDGCVRERFRDCFGREIEDFAAFKKACESLSPRSRKNYSRCLPWFFLQVKKDPDMVIAERQNDLRLDDPERYERLVAGYIKAKSAGGKNVIGDLSVIQGFFRNNGKRLALELPKLKLPKGRKTRKFAPSNEDVRKLMEYAELARDRLLITVLYQLGCNPRDASLLQVRDLSMQEWTYSESSRSKTGEVWRKVVTPDIVEALKSYRCVRASWGPSEPLFMGREGPLDNQGIGAVIHGLIKRVPEFADIEGFSAKSFRDAFEDALMDGRVNHKVKESLMGHVSGIEHTYGSYNKMVAAVVEGMKQAYPYLCLSDKRGEEETSLREELEAVKSQLALLSKWVEESKKAPSL